MVGGQTVPSLQSSVPTDAFYDPTWAEWFALPLASAGCRLPGPTPDADVAHRVHAGADVLDATGL